MCDGIILGCMTLLLTYHRAARATTRTYTHLLTLQFLCVAVQTCRRHDQFMEVRREDSARRHQSRRVGSFNCKTATLQQMLAIPCVKSKPNIDMCKRMRHRDTRDGDAGANKFANDSRIPRMLNTSACTRKWLQI